jgi:hypothetical protein
MTDEAQLQQTVRDALVLAAQTARDMLQGNLSFIEGSRVLAKTAYTAGLDRDPDFVTMIAIDSETDSLPVERVRTLWDAGALSRIEDEITKAEEWARKCRETACRSIVDRFGSLEPNG